MSSRVRLLLELACAASSLALVAVSPAPARAPARSKEVRFFLAALGQREARDGTWHGVDLLADGHEAVDRLQLTLRPESAVQVVLEDVGGPTPRRLFPSAGQTGLLRPHVAYSFPAPSASYELEGTSRLRLTLRPPTSTAAAEPALRVPGRGSEPLTVRLSDGTPFEVGLYRLRASGPATVELELNGR